MIGIPTNTPGRFYFPVIETAHNVRQAIVKNSRLTLRCNAALLQNNGNCDVILDGGFTLIPGQSYWFGNYAEMNVIRVDMQVQFDETSTPDTPIKKLEIVEVLANLSGSGFYIDQPSQP